MAGGQFSTAKLYGMTIRESATDGSDFTNPDADYRRMFLGEDGLLHVKDSAGAVTSPYSAAGATVAENFLTGDTTIVNANTFYDGPSLSCVAGTYFFIWAVSMTNTTGARWYTAKLWDGSTMYGGAHATYSSTSGAGVTISGTGYGVLGSTTTIKVSVASDGGSSTSAIKATASSNGTTNKASHLVAVKIA